MIHLSVNCQLGNESILLSGHVARVPVLLQHIQHLLLRQIASLQTQDGKAVVRK